MSHVNNSIASMERMLQVVEEAKRKTAQSLEELLGAIESAHSSGNLEPENYEQLTSSYVKNNIEPNIRKAIDEDAAKMESYLNTLRQKIQDYLNVSG